METRQQQAVSPLRASNLEMEPYLRQQLDRRLSNRDRPAYTIVDHKELAQRLQPFVEKRAPGAVVSDVARLGGGASKEQFRFKIAGTRDHDGTYVLRMDPFESVVETSREREFELLGHMQSIIPVPGPVWLDSDGSELGRPSIIMTFEKGVVKPTTASTANVTGTGIVFGEHWRSRLCPQFMNILTAIHNYDWKAANFEFFDKPVGDPKRPASWQVELWARTWRDDHLDPNPVVALAENWMRDNLPDCEDPVIVHGDYRAGNFLFDEDSGNISAMLDWELAHIGDPHEDLAWIMQTGTLDEGKYYYSGLLTRDELIEHYQSATGRQVNEATLQFYEVLSAYKCLIIVEATGAKVARLKYSHQDVLLTYMAAFGPKFHTELCQLLKKVKA